MNTKAVIMIGMVVGSTLGSYLPALWGADFLSPASLALGMVGGFAGIWLGYKLTR